MKNMTFADALFAYTISITYFAPERDKNYGNEWTRSIAYTAMMELWCAQSVKYKNCSFGQQNIRRIITDDMMPDLLDDAIKLWKMTPRHNHVYDLARALFYMAIVGKGFYDSAAATYSKPDYGALYYAWLDFRAYAKIEFAPIVPEGRVAYAV